MENNDEKTSCKKNNNMTAGLILIAVGTVFAIQRFTGISMGDLWPILLIGIGLVIVFRSFNRNNKR